MLRHTLPRRMAPTITTNYWGVTKITLDNPKSLNAVTHETVLVMRDLLIKNHLDTKQKATTKAFVIRGAGAKAFCSGGDVVSIATQKPAGVRHKFFYTEYQVNHAIGEIKDSGLPYVALWNGIVMGGGFGVSIHGSHRVCTPNTLFAMPETAIGLFPDVGGSWVLPRLPHDGLGLFLGLTGARLKGADIVHAGLGTHYVASNEELDKVEAAIVDEINKSKTVDDALAATTVSGKDNKDKLPPFSLADKLPAIQHYFGSSRRTSLKKVLDGLAEAKEDKWAQELLAKLKTFSPTSVAVSFEAHQRGAECASRAEAFEMEYRLSQSMANHNDFYAGVDALLLSKHKNPKWEPATLEEVTEEQIKKMFEKREPQQPTWDPRTPEETAFKYLN